MNCLDQSQDVWNNIANYLRPIDLVRLRQTCSRLNGIVMKMQTHWFRHYLKIYRFKNGRKGVKKMMYSPGDNHYMNLFFQACHDYYSPKHDAKIAKEIARIKNYENAIKMHERQIKSDRQKMEQRKIALENLKAKHSS